MAPTSTPSRSPTPSIRSASRGRSRRARRRTMADEFRTEHRMADTHAKPHHDYHLVDPSPWPAVGAVSAFLMALGGIAWLHHMFVVAPYVFGVGVLGMAYTMIG